MDVLSTSQQTSRVLSQLETLPTDLLAKCCRNFLQRLVLGSSNVSIEEKYQVAVDAIGSLLLDAAKTRSSDAQLRAVLLEQSLSNDVIDILVAFYQQQQDTITQHLSQIGISFPQVVGVDWRLDYLVRSKVAGRENVPMFHVCLHVMDKEEDMRDIKFLASLEEMQDLLSKVRDAVKQVERVLNTTEI